MPAGIKGFKAGGQDNRPYFDFMYLLFLRKINSACRTVLFTGLTSALFLEIDTVIRINYIFERYCLGILHIDGLAFSQALVLFILDLAGTSLGTDPAGDTFIHVYIARTLTHSYLKIPRITLNGFHVRQGDEIDVQVPADLDQFGGDNSHGTVVGGKRLVQRAHHTTNGGGFFNHVHEEARIRQIQS